MKQLFLLAFFSLLFSFQSQAQCEYTNGPLEDWATSELELGGVTNEVTLPVNHVSAVRFTLNLLAIFFGDPSAVQMWEDDPQLFFGIDQSTDTSEGDLAVKLQGDPDFLLADLYSVFACDEIQDMYSVDLKHVGMGADTVILYGVFDEYLAQLPQDLGSFDTLTAFFYQEIAYTESTDYETFSPEIFINDPMGEVDTFTVYVLAFFEDADNYVLVDNIKFGAAGVDMDMDGFFEGEDCDDNNAAVNPGATEVCNGIDDNCDGNIDEGLLSTFYADVDEDGFGDAANFTESCDQPVGFVMNADDCDDNDENEFPGQVWYKDVDGDGYSDATTLVSCERPADYFLATELTSADGDCDDTNADINPGATEVCDNIDNDCNGMIDDNVVFQDYFLDGDGDGYGAGMAVNDCQSPGADYVLQAGDCDDTNADVNPDAVEICDNIDNDCNGMVDDDVLFQDYFLDGDGDGFGAGMAVNDCQSPGADYVLQSGDCDDTNAAINPGASEACNGLDDDCNGMTDDGLVFQDYFLDGDGDGFGADMAVNDCQSPGADYVLQSGDCDDTNAAINPGASEICNGVDDDCNGQIDEGVLTTFYEDMDGDGFGDENSTLDDCDQPMGYVTNADDCDDTNADINPGATDIPNNGIDEDCDGMDAISSTDELAELGIRIYPNPVSQTLRLENVPAVGYRVELANGFGQKLRSNAAEGNTRLDFGDLPSGLYFVKITEMETGRRKVEMVAKE